MARLVRNVSSKLNSLSEFVDQANEAFETISGNISDLEIAIKDLMDRVSRLESSHKQKGKKVSEEE
ncbi:MAG: hypothetical protein QXU40_03020 [Candidatus Pacearchaeota archaeon]